MIKQSWHPSSWVSTVRPTSIFLLLVTTVMLLVSAQSVRAQDKPEVLSSEEVTKLVEQFERATSRYRISLRAGPIARMRPGVAQTVRLELEVAGLGAGYDIYALVLMAEGDRVVTERISRDVRAPGSSFRHFGAKFGSLNYNGFATFSRRDGQPFMKTGYAELEGVRFTIGGTLGNGMLSTLRVGDGSFPVHVSLPFETLGKAFLAESPDLEHLRVENESFPLTVNLVYLGTSGGARSEVFRDIAVEITPPTGSIYYDGVLLAPAVVKRFANGFSIVRYDDTKTNRLILASVAPEGAQRPPARATSRRSGARSTTANPPDLRVTATSRGALRIGRPATVDVRVTYSRVQSDTEMYVLLHPANGDQLVTEQSGSTRRLSAQQVAMQFCEDPEARAGRLRISNKPIVLTAPLYGAMEGGWIASVKEGGGGTVGGTITFTPPPLNAYYDRIKAIPVALTWNDQGRLCTVLETASAPNVELRIAGR